MGVMKGDREISMNNRLQLVSMVLVTMGILFIMAMAFKIMPANYAIFAGVACFIIAGAVKRFSSPHNRDS
jgi:hypothetical protein